jgi:hypothetical protein
MARNVIERIFGVLKHRFRILILSPKYNLRVQAQIPAALCAIHNFIRLHDLDEGPLPGVDGASDKDTSSQAEQPDLDAVVGQDTASEMSSMRDQIAEAMWDQYQRVLQERELADIDSEVDDLLASDSEGQDTDEDAMELGP